MDEFRRGDLTFEVLDTGPADGPVVLLLHGFPQFNTCWTDIAQRLTEKGYRCVAPNQRGYSPGARPPRRRDYVGEELVGDVLALIDALGVEKVHLVGHDWGAAVAWAAAALIPERLASMTALSVPHPAAMAGAMFTSSQALSSWYIFAFQVPRIPEWTLTRGGGKVLTYRLRDGGQSRENTARDVQAMMSSGALRTAINWYRALPFNKPGVARAKSTVPTMHIWSDGDKFLRAKGARETARYVDADYRFEVISGASHWLPEECPDTIAELLLEWFAAHPIPGAAIQS